MNTTKTHMEAIDSLGLPQVINLLLALVRNPTYQMTKRFISIALAAIMAASACAQTPAYQLASSRLIEGKLQDGQCMTYAVALSKALVANGIHGRLVFYTWQVRGSAPSQHDARGAHVFVRYEDADGTWIVDNEHAQPIAVPAEHSLTQLVTDLQELPDEITFQLADPERN